jgi:radical SAM protein with 4Fe4S-binding SPASM domain
MADRLTRIFPACAKLLPERFFQNCGEQATPECVTEQVAVYAAARQVAGYLPDLARVELARYQLENRPSVELLPETGSCRANPTLELVPVFWGPLLPLLDGVEVTPRPDEQILIFWRHPRTGTPHYDQASAADLLALKIIAEQLDPLTVARETRRPVGVIDAVIEDAVERGILLSPPSRLRRELPDVPIPAATPEEFRVAEVFTLQWHITHACDLHCRHCYDRSRREDVPLAQGVAVLDQMRTFCRDHHVRGQVSFSGGNPFLHPDFTALYRAAHERNLTPAILGNPVSEARLDEVLDIARPAFYQVSLEGLREHNSMVMLTLTRANLDQVLPLAELLRDRVDLFTFNRLAMVGEGARLESPGRDEYRDFLRNFLRAKAENPAIALKDSLINIHLERDRQGLFGGCTGFGCGAAFNFVSLLPDGQVHACRKFPSPIGDIHRQTLDEIYHAAAARAYRRGCGECAECRLRAVCGGCLAVAYGWGLDPLKKKDPACFIDP